MIALGFERVVFHGTAVVRFRTCRITGGGGSARKNCCIVCLLHERWDRKRRRWLMAGGGGGIILPFFALDFGGSLISTAMVGLGPPLATTLFGHQKSRHRHRHQAPGTRMQYGTMIDIESAGYGSWISSEIHYSSWSLVMVLQPTPGAVVVL